MDLELTDRVIVETGPTDILHRIDAIPTAFAVVPGDDIPEFYDDSGRDV